jgi:hypothetical protein
MMTLHNMDRMTPGRVAEFLDRLEREFARF